jgi:APA family basic amino acid/polyamine antiporter
LIILIYFIGNGIPEVDNSQIKSVFNINFQSLISTAGLVYISYVGVTNVASLSE